MGLTTQQILASIENGTTSLGIEFGSTRIKAVLTAEDNSPIASGSHDWENRLEDGIWTYTLEDIWTGLQDSYAKMAEDVKEKYGVVLKKTGAVGFSAMMHGYMVFDAEGDIARSVPYMEKYDHRRSIGKTDKIVILSHSAAMEHRTLVPGDVKWRGTCEKYCVPDDTCRLYSLETDW